MHKRRRSTSPEDQDTLRNTLHVQAYEATILRSQPEAARRAVTREVDGQTGGLISWLSNPSDEDKNYIWLDRFDARMLLTSLPTEPTDDQRYSSQLDPLAFVGWDDLPSDSEDTFFMSADEVTSYRADKRRLEMETNRQKRMRALEEQEASERDPNDPAGWGDDDEQPNEAQQTLMDRTAAHIARSPNSQQLESRILANHGTDPRFAFLRGRWRNAWVRSKSLQKMPQPLVGRASSSTSGAIILGALGDYGESDSSDAENAEDDRRETNLITTQPLLSEAPQVNLDNISETVLAKKAEEEEEVEKARRRARAKLWRERRNLPV